MKSKITQEIVDQVLFRLDENSRMVRIALDRVSDEEIWQRPNQVSNSIGNLMLHLCGNITQYAISSLGEKEDVRERDKEFEAKGGIGKAELIRTLMHTVNMAKETIKSTSEAQFMRSREVQGFQMSGIGIILHVVEHYSYHTGQIAFWVKQLKDKDLGFYEDVDLNTRNNE